MEELKPCPFCGGKAELEQSGKQQLTIKCTRCLIKKVQKWKFQSQEWLAGKLVEDWNKRVKN